MIKTNETALDPRLKADCLFIGRLDAVRLLLMNNALLPWFILVPNTTITDIVELPPVERECLFELTSEIGRLLRREMACERTNVAAIGNVVSQLHVHIVGRRSDDFCWPGVVWGQHEHEEYSQTQVEAIRTRFRAHFGPRLVP
ncbi:MAG: HIT family protein [Xanthomonadales bacterium]|nr:HIT family protein [Xanthomonadales bacterium]